MERTERRVGAGNAVAAHHGAGGCEPLVHPGALEKALRLLSPVPSVAAMPVLSAPKNTLRLKALRSCLIVALRPRLRPHGAAEGSPGVPHRSAAGRRHTRKTAKNPKNIENIYIPVLFVVYVYSLSLILLIAALAS